MFEERKLKIKNMIEETINAGKLEEAKLGVQEYKKIFFDDIDIYSMEGVIYIIEDNLEQAKEILLEGFMKDNLNFDINYNLAYIAELEGNKINSYYFYKRAHQLCQDNVLKDNIYKKLNELLNKNEELSNYNRTKIAVFCIKGLDNFLHDIILHLSYYYEVKVILVSNNEELKLVDQWMEWADICWFEWCNDLAVYGSKLPVAKKRKVICRLHRYEVYTNYIFQVRWDSVDKIIFVSDYIKSLFLSKVNFDETSCEVIFNGVKTKKIFDDTKLNKDKGFNIAWLGYLNLRKNPMLALQILYKLIKIDSRYKLFIAGSFQDDVLEEYIKSLVKKLSLEKNIIFCGFIPNEKVFDWLKDKDYIISTSISEGHPVGIMEAMACGLKPVIHYFPSIEEFYPEKYIYYTVDEAIDIITSKEYNSFEYIEFIQKNYSLKDQIDKIKYSIENCQFSKNKQIIDKTYKALDKNFEFNNIDDLTILIPTYNRANLLNEDLVFGYKLGNQRKIILDDASEDKNKEILLELINSKEKYGIENIIFNKENKGIAEVINIGLKHIKTKYMCLCGDDDRLFSFDRNEIINSIKNLDDEYIFVIPQYVLNIDLDKNISLGYDRNEFNGKTGKELLEIIFKTGEISALAAGMIVRKDLIINLLPEKIFRVSEDYVLLSRLLANNLNKKVKIINSFVYLRRVNEGTLSSSINEEKLSIHLLSLLISGFYSLKNGFISKKDLFIYLKKRAELIQELYGTGLEYMNFIFDYLTKKIDLNDFIEVNKSRFIKHMTFENMPMEVIKILDII